MMVWPAPASVACPKCHAPLCDFYAESTPEELARACEWESPNGCKYVPCDDFTCRALKSPTTLEEWKAAAEHWRSHHYLSGCSHGR